MDWALSHLMTTVELFFAGAWAAIWHKGIGVAAIVILLGLAFGSQMLAGIPMVGPFLARLFAPMRKDLCWAAFAVALVLGGEWIGARDEAARNVAKTVVIEHVTEGAVAKTMTPAARAAKDPWDDPNN
jgi:hypothetical protein